MLRTGEGNRTLTTVLRSLTGGDRTIIDKRRRFNSATVPKVIVNFEQETPAGTGQRRAIFDYHAKSADAWSALIQGIIIFDDIFVNENVFSGLMIDPSFARRMYDLAMGERGKQIEHAIDELADPIMELPGNDERLPPLQSQLQAKRDEREALAKIVLQPYEDAVNRYLQCLNTLFSIKLSPKQGAFSYKLLIGDQEIDIVSRQQEHPHPEVPEFQSTLSAGDRNTLALALFFAYLDQDPLLATKIVVIDDPITSLDDPRARATVREIRALANRTRQLLVMSHDKRFMLRLVAAAEKIETSVLEMVRSSNGSAIRTWDTNEESITDHDRYHRTLRQYDTDGVGSKRDVAAAVRLVVEGFFG